MSQNSLATIRRIYITCFNKSADSAACKRHGKYVLHTVLVYLIKKMHYANMSVQYTAIFHGCKNDNFQMKFFDIFLIFAQNIDCGYTLEPPQRGGSNEYTQSIFWSKNKKKYVYPSKTHFFYIKVRCKGVFITRTCYPDELQNA